MDSQFFRTLLRAVALLTIVVLAGCGDIQWFPPYVRLPTSPDPFSFTAVSGTEKSVPVTSNAIKVTGLTAATSPISVSGAADSKYSINGGAATSSPGTVSNNDEVTVTHTSSSALGTSTTTTLTIGNQSADFVSTTKYVLLSTFTTVQNGIFMISHADITSSDGAPGTHVIKIKDSLGSANALYQVTEQSVVNPDLTLFTNVQQTFLFLNGKRIFVRNLAANSSATTTLTIDGVDTVVPLNTPTP